MNGFSTSNWNSSPTAFPIPRIQRKCNFFSCVQHEGTWGSRVKTPLFRNSSYLEIGTQLYPTPVLTAKERTPIHMNRRLGGPSISLNVLERR